MPDSIFGPYDDSYGLGIEGESTHLDSTTPVGQGGSISTQFESLLQQYLSGSAAKDAMLAYTSARRRIVLSRSEFVKYSTPLTYNTRTGK